MAGGLTEPGATYDWLWQEAAEALEHDKVRLDPWLNDRTHDRRRSVTLLARPSPDTCARVATFLQEISAAAPGQHLYQPSELHLTILSIIPGSEHWQEEARRLPEYLAAMDDVLKDRRKFSVAFRGVTASPDAVMIQGFPRDDTLEKLRDDLRAALTERGLGANLDRRYRIVTAHLTAARFCSPSKDWRPLRRLLADRRGQDFGVTEMASLQLIESDWYASSGSVRVLREFPLT